MSLNGHTPAENLNRLREVNEEIVHLAEDATDLRDERLDLCQALRDQGLTWTVITATMGNTISQEALIKALRLREKARRSVPIVD